MISRNGRVSVIDHPGVQLALRTATSVLITFASAMVLLHVTIYLSGPSKTDHGAFVWLQVE